LEFAEVLTGAIQISDSNDDDVHLVCEDPFGLNLLAALEVTVDADRVWGSE
jgi:hypothetical protein